MENTEFTRAEEKKDKNECKETWCSIVVIIPYTYEADVGVARFAQEEGNRKRWETSRRLPSPSLELPFTSLASLFSFLLSSLASPLRGLFSRDWCWLRTALLPLLTVFFFPKLTKKKKKTEQSNAKSLSFLFTTSLSQLQ